jgi:hypothetical protein
MYFQLEDTGCKRTRIQAGFLNTTTTKLNKSQQKDTTRAKCANSHLPGDWWTGKYCSHYCLHNAVRIAKK